MMFGNLRQSSEILGNAKKKNEKESHGSKPSIY